MRDERNSTTGGGEFRMATDIGDNRQSSDAHPPLVLPQGAKPLLRRVVWGLERGDPCRAFVGKYMGPSFPRTLANWSSLSLRLTIR